jgi:hypothetical protein
MKARRMTLQAPGARYATKTRECVKVASAGATAIEKLDRVHEARHQIDTLMTTVERLSQLADNDLSFIDIRNLMERVDWIIRNRF